MERNEDFVANFKNLLFSALYNWKKIILAALAFGIVLGGFQAYSSFAGSSAANDDDLLSDEKYWLETTERQYNNLEEYLKNSVLMKIDHNEAYKASATYYIDTDYRIQPGSIYQDINHSKALLLFYEKHLKDHALHEKIASEIGIQPHYLQELISVSTDEEASLSVTVLYTDKESASKIMSFLDNELAAAHKTLNKTVCEHSLTKLLDSCGAVVDQAVYTAQREKHDAFVNYQTKLTELQNNLGKPVSADDAAPENAGLKATIVTFIKWAVLGCCVGAMLAVLVVWMSVIFSDKITSEYKIANKLSLEVLGTLSQEKKRGAITRWLRKIEGRQLSNTEENSQYIAENLLNHIGSGKNILVCSDTNADGAEIVVQNLQKHLPDVTLIATSSLLNDAQALKQLRNADALVLTVVVGESCGKNLSASMKHIQQMNKPIAGIVAVD